MAKDKTSFVVADSASGSKDKGGSTGASSDMSFYGSGKIGPPQDTGVFDGGGADIADTAMSASGSFVPWAEIVRQIVGHIVRGGSAAMDYTKQRRRTKAAWEQAHMSNILGIIDMKLENERQEIRRESMMEALAVIDEGFGHGTTEKAAMNRKAIRSVINQIERADAERASAMLEEEGAQTSRNQRQSMARRGGGGSIEDAATRQRAGGLARGILETRKMSERSGRGVKQGMDKQRAAMRGQARKPVGSMRPDFTISKGVMNQMRIAEAADETPDMILQGAWERGAGEGLGDLAEIFTGYRAEAADEKTRKEKLEAEEREKELREMLRGIQEGTVV